MADLLFANLVPLLGLGVAAIGVAIFRLSRRDRPMAAVIVVLGLAFVVISFAAEEGAPPVEAPSPAATPSPAPRLAARVAAGTA